MSHLSDIARRLREGAFNNLEDIILEAADASPSENDVILRLLAGRLSKVEREAKENALIEIEEAGESADDAKEEGFETAREEASDILWDKIRTLEDDDDDLREILESLRDKIDALQP